MSSKRPHIKNLPPRVWTTFQSGYIKHLREIVLVAGVYFVYMFVRKIIIADIESVSFDNAIKVVSFELASGFLWEPHWQLWTIETSKALVVFFNWVYIITFWPIILVTGVIVYIKARSEYFHYRNIALLSFVFALIVYASFPLAPPRFLPEYGFIDTIQRFGPSQYGSREMASFYNAYAAMPSLHFAWTVLFGVLFLRMKHIWLKPLGVIYPTMTFFAITVTGNHYIIDAVGGAVIIMASFVVYEGLLRLNLHPSLPLAVGKAHLGRAAAYLHYTLLGWKARTLLTLTAMKSHLELERLSSGKWKKASQFHTSSLKVKRIQVRGDTL